MIQSLQILPNSTRYGKRVTKNRLPTRERMQVSGRSPVPEIEREFMISLDLFGHHADVAKFHAELVVGRAGLRVVGTPSVVAEGLKPYEDFIDAHADG